MQEALAKKPRPHHQAAEATQPWTAGPFLQDPTACLRPPTRTRPRSTPTPRGAGRTGSRPQPATELVSVPPSSTIQATRSPPWMGNRLVLAWLCTDQTCLAGELLLRKEVIQPHLPVRLPCYDFVPIADPAFDGSLHKGWATGFGRYRLS